MRIIEKNTALVRTLTPAEDELLSRFVQGDLAGPRLLQANQLLLKIRAAGHWLACDCQPRAMPILNVNLNGNTGTLFLKNNPGTADHAPDCAFIKEEREASRAEEPEILPAAWLPRIPPCA